MIDQWKVHDGRWPSRPKTRGSVVLPFLWTALTDPEQRRRSVQSGWKDVRNVFLMAATLDAIYQFMVQQFIYPLELLFTSALLAVVPYCVLRGPVNRVARRAISRKRGGDAAGDDGGSRPQ